MYAAAVFLPLIGSFIAGILTFAGGLANEETKKKIDRGSQLVTVGAMLLAAVAATFAFIHIVVHGNTGNVELFTWISSGTLEFSWALRGDTLALVMLLMVTWISSMIHIYSIGYMSHDKSIPRFMAYLSLFTFFMLMLVTSNNLVQLFFGWEGWLGVLSAYWILVREAVSLCRRHQGFCGQQGRGLWFRTRYLCNVCAVRQHFVRYSIRAC